MSEVAPLTPLIEQYEGVKARYPGHLVLFRVGDFYETFGDDAKLLSRELEVVLTARAPDGRGERLPMAGVPQHAVESYLARLVRKGYKVALCDQVEDARFAKGLVRREVTRVVTPGTVVEERILPGPEHNFLACIEPGNAGPGTFVAVDITTGDWVGGSARLPGVDGLLSALAPFSPREILLLPVEDSTSSKALETLLRREFPSARIERCKDPGNLLGLPSAVRAALDTHAELRRVGACLAGYLSATQPKLLPFLEPIPYAADRRLELDAKTLRHLEIARPMNPDDPDGATVVSTWDETVTASGRRTLSFWLRNPLNDVNAILQRQEIVEAFLRSGTRLGTLRRQLAHVADLSRISARLVSRRLRHGELGVLRDSLARIAEVHGWLESTESGPVLLALARVVDPLPDVCAKLTAALPDSSAPGNDEGRGFRSGFSTELDGWCATESQGLAELENLEREEQLASGIRTLKVGFNQVFGYYFEVSRANLTKVPAHFRRKQTLAGGERFTSDRLTEIESKILAARERVTTREAELWEEFLTELETDVGRIHRLSRALGEIDALASFAFLARERGYVRPVIDASRRLQIRDGRHPVLDRTLHGRFVPNDTDLDADDARLLVLTGPNMSGKSTYMRQVGLLVVLAQAGAFLPVKYARIGVVSALFTRMGFTDEIGRGKSSFMVEMSEVAEILHSADAGALVLLDEVGRGTSTFDGLALAWSTLRYLHDEARCRTLVATHYHQLTELIEALPGARNGHLAVRDDAGEIVFLFRLVPGSTDRSYGLHVARLAGLPSSVLQEADRLLRRLEEEGVELGPKQRGTRRSGTRYTQAVLLPAEATPGLAPMVESLRTLSLDNLTPLQALAWIAEWRRRLDLDASSGVS